VLSIYTETLPGFLEAKEGKGSTAMTDIVQRLINVRNKVTGNKFSEVNLGMSIPADPERDLDIIVSDAIDEIERLRHNAETDAKWALAAHKMLMDAGVDCGSSDYIKAMKDQQP